jgi:hypothetical protein
MKKLLPLFLLLAAVAQPSMPVAFLRSAQAVRAGTISDSQLTMSIMLQLLLLEVL